MSLGQEVPTLWKRLWTVLRTGWTIRDTASPGRPRKSKATTLTSARLSAPPRTSATSSPGIRRPRPATWSTPTRTESHTGTQSVDPRLALVSDLLTVNENNMVKNHKFYLFDLFPPLMFSEPLTIDHRSKCNRIMTASHFVYFDDTVICLDAELLSIVAFRALNLSQSKSFWKPM